MTTQETNDAKKLGFKAPVRNNFNVDPNQKTNTLGYFNPNAWPVHIVNSGLGFSVTLQTKQYIVEAPPLSRKINDPRLEQHVGPNMLARETSEAEVPVVWINIAPTQSNNSYGFVGTQAVEKDAKGNFVQPAQAAEKHGSASNNPVGALSLAQARKMGLVGNIRPLDENQGVPETDGAPPQNIPELKVPAFAQNKTVPVKSIQEKAAAEALLKQAIPDDGGGDVVKSVINRVKKMMKPATLDVKPEVETVRTVIGDLPVPQLDITEEQVSGAVPTAIPIKPTVVAPAQDGWDVKAQSPKDFICKEDGKKFKYRSELLRHANKKYPDKVDNIMSPYPAGMRRN